MANLTVTVVGAAGGSFGTKSRTFDFSDDDSDRILAGVVAFHGVAADGTPRTVDQAFAAVCGEFFTALIARALAVERNAAAEAAAAAVDDIAFTVA